MNGFRGRNLVVGGEICYEGSFPNLSIRVRMENSPDNRRREADINPQSWKAPQTNAWEHPSYKRRGIRDSGVISSGDFGLRGE